MAKRRIITALGEALRNARQALGMDQADVAARVAVSTRTISRWENGALYPEPAQAARLYDVLDTAPRPIALALAGALRLELDEEAPPAPAPTVPVVLAAPQASGSAAPAPAPTSFADAEVRACLEGIVLAASEERDVLPRHLRAFGVELLQAVEKLGVDARKAGALLATPIRERAKVGVGDVKG